MSSNKLRESLKEIADICDGKDIGGLDRLVSIYNIAKHALAEPLKNCEVGSIQEQAERFRSFCGMHKPEVNEFSEHGELLCPSTGCELIACNYGQCALAWTHMPYESEVK
jgi:hypothetical protein